MTSKLYRSNSDGWWELRNLLRDGKPWHNTTRKFRGELWDKHSAQVPHGGRMSQADRNDMINVSKLYGIDYVVYSYATPVAYRDGRGIWHMPDAGYSMATKTKHLSNLRPAIAELQKEMEYVS